ncbi:MAG: F-box protein [Verrucomicrobiota bacterium]|nr:F-box protein [Verrucomicrobiota bacterium]
MDAIIYLNNMEFINSITNHLARLNISNCYTTAEEPQQVNENNQGDNNEQIVLANRVVSRSNQSEHPTLSTLASDLFLHIFFYLETKDVARCMRVCRSMHTDLSTVFVRAWGVRFVRSFAGQLEGSLTRKIYAAKDNNTLKWAVEWIVLHSPFSTSPPLMARLSQRFPIPPKLRIVGQAVAACQGEASIDKALALYRLLQNPTLAIKIADRIKIQYERDDALIEIFSRLALDGCNTDDILRVTTLVEWRNIDEQNQIMTQALRNIISKNRNLNGIDCIMGAINPYYLAVEAAVIGLSATGERIDDILNITNRLTSENEKTQCLYKLIQSVTSVTCLRSITWTREQLLRIADAMPPSEMSLWVSQRIDHISLYIKKSTTSP